MARIGDVVFDCRHPAALARFWASVLDGYAVAPYDEAELARLRQLGIDDPEAQDDHIHEHGSTWILMTDPEGNEFCVCDSREKP